MKFLVIGGGISGLFVSYYLLKSGHEVVLADAARGPVRTSAFNAGQLSSRSNFTDLYKRSDVVRVSAAEKRRNPRWFRLARRPSRDRYEEVSHALSLRSLALYQQFFSTEPAEVDLVEDILDLHSTLPEQGSSGGSGARFLAPRELSELGYKGFEGGWLMKERSLHSGKLLEYLRVRISDLGAKAVSGEARVKKSGSRVSYAVVDGERFTADTYVVTGGSWAGSICAPLDYNPMVIPARGLVLLYRTQGKRIIDYPAHYEDEGATVTQHDADTVRLTSFFELVGFNPKFSQARKGWLFETVTAHLSRPFKLGLLEAGIGYRPSTPDQLPSVGRIPRCDNAYIVAGSGRKGMVLAPELSRLLMKCVLGPGEADGNALRALDPARFE